MKHPFTWLRNATRRTIVACLPALARPDDEFAREHLEAAEFDLYMRMDPRDRQHACSIARRLLAGEPHAPSALIRAAFLHDVGKAEDRYIPLYRILAHLYAPARIPATPRLAGIRGAWQVRRHHHRYGARMIRQAGCAEEVAALVERHHDPAGDPEATLLKRLDDQT